MKNPSAPCRLLKLLLNGVPAVMLLASCDMLGIKNPLSDDSRSRQQVVGGRHAPVLNPSAAQAAAAASQPPHAASVETNPYDYYDNSGNTVAPPQGNANAGSKEDTVRKPMLGNPYYSKETTPPAPIPPGPQSSLAPALAMPIAASATVPAFVPSPVASLPATPAAESANNPPAITPLLATPQPPASLTPVITPVADVSEAPKTLVIPPDQTLPSPAAGNRETVAQPALQPKQPSPPPDNSPNILPTRPGDQSSDIEITPPVASVPPAAESPVSESKPQASGNAGSSTWYKPSWVTHWLDKHETSEQDVVQNAPYPALSSIPPTPLEFTAVKNAKQQNMQDLQSEHAQAQQEKQQLDSEPSQQQPMVPADTPTDAKISDAGAVANPVVTPSQNPPEKSSAAANEPVLLGHVAAPPLASAGIAVETNPAAGAAQFPPLSPTAGGPQDNANNAALDNALPPPQLLETVKILPPSRYGDREQAPQQQPAQ